MVLPLPTTLRLLLRLLQLLPWMLLLLLQLVFLLLRLQGRRLAVGSSRLLPSQPFCQAVRAPQRPAAGCVATDGINIDWMQVCSWVMDIASHCVPLCLR